MQGFYNITTAIKDQLLLDHFCNTVTIGDIFNVDLKKQTIFPLSHIIVNSADLENNVWRFNMTVISMDIVDKSKELETDAFLGNDNEHDVLNTQLAVLNRLLEVLRRGSLSREFYQLDGNPNLEPFTERFENYLAGWAATFDVLIPNTMTACDGLVTTVACANGTVTITDDSGNTLYTLSVASGGTDTQIISDSTVTITDDASNVLHTVSVNAEGSASQVISDSTVTITDDAANVLHTVSVNAEGSASQIISDSTAVLKTTAGVTLSTTSINAEASADITAPDTALEVNGVSKGSVVAGSTVDVQLSDSGGVVTPTSVTQVGNDLQIVLPDAPAAVTRSTATLMKTGQTTSYRTGDDGDIEAGRATAFLTLDAAPLHNDGTATINTTTNRFTDELGGQTYTNNIVLDWSTWNGSTLLGYDRTVRGLNTWNDAIDGALALTTGGFNVWRLPNITEYFNIYLWEVPVTGAPFQYAPFNISTTGNYATSTTRQASTTQNIFIANSTNPSWGGIGKTTTQRWIACRTFSLSLLNVLS